MDLFDDAYAQAMIKRLLSLEPAKSTGGKDDSRPDAITTKERVMLATASIYYGIVRWVLYFVRRFPVSHSLSDRSAKKISSEIGNLVKMLTASHHIRIQAASASCLFQLANQGTP